MAEQRKEPNTGVLRRDVEFIREPEPMLFDRQADAYFRLDATRLDIVSYLTKTQPVGKFLEALNRNGIAVTREELLQLLGFLQQHNLLEPEYGVIGAKREKAKELRAKTAFLRFSSAYIFFKLPPLRPERLYRKIAPYVSWICGPRVVWTLAVPSLVGYLLLLRNFGAVKDAFVASLSWAGLVKYFAAIVVLKVLHESAHSLAAIRFGCRVRGIGIGFMVFVPRFFTDTTDAWRLPRRQRLFIDGAGILSELLVGGIAALLWTYAAPGAWQSTLFYVFAVSTISTIFVNGNPCIRYDGYYILSDLVRIDNLMMRAGEHFKAWWRHYALGLGPKPTHARETFLLVFGLCTFIYRIFLYTSIILIIYHKFTKVVALGMMVLELFSILIYPVWRELKTLKALSKHDGVKARTWLWAAILASLLFVSLLPLSWSVDLVGETTRFERQLVTVDEGGYLTEALRPVARSVRKGRQILALEAPALDFAVRRLEGTLARDALLMRIQEVDDQAFAEAPVTARKLESDRCGQMEFARRRSLLTIESPTDGVFVPSFREELSAGAYLPRGMVIGRVVSGDSCVDAYAQDDDIGKLAVGDEAVVRLPGRMLGLDAEVVEVDRLPVKLTDSPVLQCFGGPVPVYFDLEKGGGYKTVQALYRVRLKVSEPLRPGRVCWVEVGHAERFLSIIWRNIMSVFRKEF